MARFAICLAVALAPLSEAGFAPLPQELAARRRVSQERIKRVLFTEAHEELKAREHGRGLATQDDHDAFTQEAFDFEWRRAFHREQEHIDRARRMTEEEASQVNRWDGKSAFLVCDDDARKGGVRRGHEVKAHFGDDRMKTIFNRKEMTCFYVHAEASKALDAPQFMQVEAAPSAFRLSRGARSMAVDAAHEIADSPRAMALDMCPGVDTHISHRESLLDEWMFDLQSELSASHHTRALNEEFFWTSSQGPGDDHHFESKSWGQALTDRTPEVNDVCANAAATVLRPVLHPNSHGEVVLDNWEAFIKHVKEGVYGSDTEKREAAEACSLRVMAFFATRHEVCHVSFQTGHVLNNLTATGILQSGGTATSNRVFWDAGIRGEGQIAGCSDTGLDQGHCHFIEDGVAKLDGDECTEVDGKWWQTTCREESTVDTSRRKVIQYVNFVDNSDYNNGHGTHVASTIVGAFDQSHSGLSNYDGVAPFAQIAFMDIGDSSGRLSTPYYKQELFGPAYDAGARVHSNSWGSTGNAGYDVSTRGTDQFMYDHDDMLILYSAGNSGQYRGSSFWGDYSVGAPATGKNVLSVGAACNTNHCGSINQIADYSSQGPTTDGRRKPDVVSPGFYVAAAAGRTSGESCGLVYKSGTSMAAPAAAGAAILARQYFMDGFGICSGWADGQSGGGFCVPKAATLKAVLINSGTEMANIKGFDFQNSGTYPRTNVETVLPDFFQGQGLINLNKALKLAGQNSVETFVSESAVSENDVEEYQFSATGTEFAVTLVWTDPQGTSGCSQCLINDLDLTVTDDSTGTTYYPGPESFADTVDDGIYGPPPEGYIPSTSPSDRDTINNVEKIVVPGVASGSTYTVRVTGANLDSSYPTQAYSLVASGTITEAGAVAEPTPQPTDSPTPQPTENPTPQPTENPTPEPTENPTPQPTENPTPQPTENPTPQPTARPTEQPTDGPTVTPANPTRAPTRPPTPQPTVVPTAAPTFRPTASPTAAPTASPTAAPTASPTAVPTASPTAAPTEAPTEAPIAATGAPTDAPTRQPTDSPTGLCTPGCSESNLNNRWCDIGCNVDSCDWDGGDCCVQSNPNRWGGVYQCRDPRFPTESPTTAPTLPPTPSPTARPTDSPTAATGNPTRAPTPAPTAAPSTAEPTAAPTENPTRVPTSLAPTRPAEILIEGEYSIDFGSLGSNPELVMLIYEDALNNAICRSLDLVVNGVCVADISGTLEPASRRLKRNGNRKLIVLIYTYTVVVRVIDAQGSSVVSSLATAQSELTSSLSNTLDDAAADPPNSPFIGNVTEIAAEEIDDQCSGACGDYTADDALNAPDSTTAETIADPASTIVSDAPTAAPTTAAPSSAPTSNLEIFPNGVAPSNADRLCSFKAELQWLTDTVGLDNNADYEAAITKVMQAGLESQLCDDSPENSVQDMDLSVYAPEGSSLPGDPDTAVALQLGYTATFNLNMYVQSSGSNDRFACLQMGSELGAYATDATLNSDLNAELSERGLEPLGLFQDEDVNENIWNCRCFYVTEFPECLREGGSSSSSGLDSGTIAGIVVGFFVAAALAAYGAHYYSTKKKDEAENGRHHAMSQEGTMPSAHYTNVRTNELASTRSDGPRRPSVEELPSNHSRFL